MRTQANQTLQRTGRASRSLSFESRLSPARPLNVGPLSTMANAPWAFDQPPDCAVITLRSIVFGGEPILHVTHDADDHGWQFLGNGDAKESDAAVVGLDEIVKLDPSVLEVADMPPGWHAWRRSKSSPWERSRRQEMVDNQTLAHKLMFRKR